MGCVGRFSVSRNRFRGAAVSLDQPQQQAIPHGLSNHGLALPFGVLRLMRCAHTATLRYSRARPRSAAVSIDQPQQQAIPHGLSNHNLAFPFGVLRQMRCAHTATLVGLRYRRACRLLQKLIFLCAMRIANLIMDMREVQRSYAETAPRFPGGSASLLDGFAKLPEEEVHVISCIQQPMQAPKKLADNIWFHPLVVPKFGWLRTGYQGCVRAVRRKLRELQPDIVQADGTERECAISAVFSGFPNVVAMQGIMSEQARLNSPRFGSYLWLTKRIEDFVLRRTAGVFCNSSYTENLVRSRARKTWLMPHPLRQSFIEPPPAAGPRECILLNVGMISPRKRQLELLDVAEALHKRGLKFEFRFVGYIYSAPGIAYGEAFKKRIQPMEAAGYARYVGAPDDDELLRQYDSAAAMVHFASEDAAPMTVLEGIGRELKFFGARQGGAVEITQDMPGVELFDVNDFSGLTEGIARWIGQGHPRPTGAAALVRERRSPVLLAKRHVEIYREVIQEAKGKG